VGLIRRIEGTYLAVDTCRMAKKSEPAKPATWTICKIAAKQKRLGVIEAPDEDTAVPPWNSRCWLV
jgi:hypothetical protein